MLVQLRQSPKQELLIFRDLNSKDLHQLFIRPYLSKQELLIDDGTVLKCDDIMRRRIFRTDKAFDDGHKIYMDESNRWRETQNLNSEGIFLLPCIPTDNDIVGFAADVTEQVLRNGFTERAWGIIKRPINWVWAIVTALFLGWLQGKLGLK